MGVRSGVCGLAVVLACALSSGRAIGQTTEAALKDRLVGKPLYLRGNWDSDKLKFDAAGKLLGSSAKRPATLCGVDVSHIQLKGNDLLLDGHRVGLLLDPTPVRKPLSENIHIEIAAAAGGDFGPALDAVFTDAPADPQPTAPAATADTAPPDIPAGATVTRPVLIKSVDPRFTPAANQLKYSGRVVVHVVIGKDGSVLNPQVLHPVGLGLDEQAISTVSQYVFKPGTLNGQPVPIDMDITVNFVFRELPPASQIMIQ